MQQLIDTLFYVINRPNSNILVVIGKPFNMLDCWEAVVFSNLPMSRTHRTSKVVEICNGSKITLLADDSSLPQKSAGLIFPLCILVGEVEPQSVQFLKPRNRPDPWNPCPLLIQIGVQQ